MLFNLQSFGLGFVSGFVTGVVARELSSVASSTLKPVIRAVVKTTVLSYERFKESMAHMGEAIEDIVAEVRSESLETVESTGVKKVDKGKPAHRKIAGEAGT